VPVEIRYYPPVRRNVSETVYNIYSLQAQITFHSRSQYAWSETFTTKLGIVSCLCWHQYDQRLTTTGGGGCSHSDSAIPLLCAAQIASYGMTLSQVH